MTSEDYNKIDMKRGVDYIGVTVVFMCHDGNGRILLHKRSDKCRDEQGRWDCGGGSMEFGEDFESAVRREVKEEYCVDPQEVKLAEIRNIFREHDGKPTHWIACIHACKVDPAQVGIGEPDKMDEIGWFEIDDLPEPLHSCFEPHFELVRPFVDLG
ncbi:MAG: NUDIX domain-containing protein [Candidatus Uhrbacteria bacterium]